MSKGLSDLQQTIQSYGTSADAINDYVQNYDASFFGDWRERVALKSQKLESARKIGADTGVAYLAGSTIKATAQKLFGKPQSEEQQEGEDEPADEPVETPTSTMEQEFPEDETAEPEDEELFQEPATLSRTITSAEGEVSDLAGIEGETVGATLGETLSGVGSAVLGGLGVASEALGPLGILTGIGIGLYELIHKPNKEPNAPQLNVASSKGEMVLPSYDSVIDTPASSSAF